MFWVTSQFFVYYIIPYVFIYSFAFIASVRIYYVNSHENKEKPLNEKVCPNFWLVVYVDAYWKNMVFYELKQKWNIS